MFRSGKDSDTFIIPVKLPTDVTEIDWKDHEEYTNHYGYRIECKDESDMFTSDTFPCLQVRAMNEYKSSNVDPKLSHRGLKVCNKVEGMIQLTEHKSAIHIGVRMKEGEADLGREQLDNMKAMVEFELNERSIGTQTTLRYLSSTDMRGSKDLEENVRYYSEEEVQNAIQNNQDLVHPQTRRRESVQYVTGMPQKGMTNISFQQP